MKSNIGSFKNCFVFLMACILITTFLNSQENNKKLLDMTYPYEKNTIYWPTAKSFHLEKVSWEVS
ncbi:MAG: hypothetical protein V3S65_10280, partial [Candidatus Aminicenantaceae bacterium]